MTIIRHIFKNKLVKSNLFFSNNLTFLMQSKSTSVYTYHKTEIDEDLNEVDDDFWPSVNVVKDNVLHLVLFWVLMWHLDIASATPFSQTLCYISPKPVRGRCGEGVSPKERREGGWRKKMWAQQGHSMPTGLKDQTQDLSHAMQGSVAVHQCCCFDK